MNELDNDLKKYFHTMAKRPIYKWSNYFDIYDAHFSRFRGTKVNVLEIGIAGGGSLQMWKWYFGQKAKIYGIDIDEAKLFEEVKIKTFQCDQANRDQLQEVIGKMPTLDIVIDDGGHTMEQQINSFEIIYPAMSDEGIYLCEDTFTCYFEEYGGGPAAKRTFMAVIKKHIDQLSANHSREQVPMTDFTASTDSMHFYNSVVVIEKGIQALPEKFSARVKEDQKGKAESD